MCIRDSPYRDKDINFRTNIENVNYVKADEITNDVHDNLIKPCGIKTIRF